MVALHDPSDGTGGPSRGGASSGWVDWAAPERNKQPILEVLARVLAQHGSAQHGSVQHGSVQHGSVRGRSEASFGLILEVASGTGQHIAHFARELPDFSWQPSDSSAEHLGHLKARQEHLKLPNLLPPLRLDVTVLPWPIQAAVAVYNANMIHISPWETSLALFAGASRILEPGSPLITYGPYRLDGEHTSESNAVFDRELQAKDPRFGVRDLTALTQVAEGEGFVLEERIAMPANNFTLVWRKLGG